MKICIAAVGQRLPDWAQAGVDDYLARFPRDFRVELKEVRPEARKGQTVERLQAAEGARLRAALPADALLIALDETGRDWTTEQFAQALRRWRDEAHDLAFIIGGADGLEPALETSAVMRLRLSSMTLPHALARFVPVEQVYRAWSILAAHPYHRGG